MYSFILYKYICVFVCFSTNQPEIWMPILRRWHNKHTQLTDSHLLEMYAPGPRFLKCLMSKTCLVKIPQYNHQERFPFHILVASCAGTLKRCTHLFVLCIVHYHWTLNDDEMRGRKTLPFRKTRAVSIFASGHSEHYSSRLLLSRKLFLNLFRDNMYEMKIHQ